MGPIGSVAAGIELILDVKTGLVGAVDATPTSFPCTRYAFAVSSCTTSAFFVENAARIWS